MKVENRKHCFHAAVGNRRDVLVIFFFAFYLAIFFKREFVKPFFSEKNSQNGKLLPENKSLNLVIIPQEDLAKFG
jgi:hypothetical protein